MESGDINTQSRTKRTDSDSRSRGSEDQRPPSLARGRDERPARLSRILDRLAEQVGPDQFERYFDGQTRMDLEGDRLEVTVPTGFLAQLLDRRFGDQIKQACAETDANVSLAFRVDREAFTPEPPTPPEAPSRTAAPRARDAFPGAARSTLPSAPTAAGGQPTSARYRLEHFIVGQSNRLAHAAAMRLAQDDGAGSIFVHGVCGIGKTHLLQGLVHHYQSIHPRAMVRYTTAEAFTNEFITAVRANKVD
ncbi:MAG: DnaA ATPase domain-containing protein, partial [Phycisphaerales bacterium]